MLRVLIICISLFFLSCSYWNGFQSSEFLETSSISPTIHLDDLDQDDKDDIISLSSQRALLSIHYNLGQRKFVREDYRLSSVGRDFAVFDFNNDGFNDICVLESGALKFFMNQNNRQFNIEEILIPSEIQVMSLAHADLNGDEFEDILIGAEDEILLYLSRDDGGFEEVRRWNHPLAKKMFLADLEGDNDLDLIVSSESSDCDPNLDCHPGYYINIQNQVEEGRIEFNRSYFIQLERNLLAIDRNDFYSDMAVGDLNRDGFSDLVYIDQDFDLDRGRFDLICGLLGNEIIEPQVDPERQGFDLFGLDWEINREGIKVVSLYRDRCIELRGVYNSLQLLDLNNDDYLDLVASGGGTPTQPSAFFKSINDFNDHNNHFFSNETEEFLNLYPSYSSDLDLADLNQDGFLDLVSGSLRYSNLSITYGNQDGYDFPKIIYYKNQNTYDLRQDFNRERSYFTTLKTAYLNQDESLDLFLFSRRENHFMVYYGEGGGLFIEAQETHDLEDLTDVIFYDADQDGDKDLIVAQSSTNRLYFYEHESDEAHNLENNTFINRGFLSLENRNAAYRLTQLAIIDLNQDHQIDLLAGFSDQNGLNVGEVILLEGQGAFNFRQTESYLTFRMGRLQVVDSDRDGDEDFFIGESSQVQFFKNSGQGEFELNSQFLESPQILDSHFLFLDENNSLDLVNLESTGPFNEVQVRIYQQNEEGEFLLSPKYQNTFLQIEELDYFDNDIRRCCRNQILISDINQDGVKDFLLQGSGIANGKSALKVFFNSSDFLEPLFMKSFYNYKAYDGTMNLADLNGDGFDDLILVSDEDDISILLNLANSSQ